MQRLFHAGGNEPFHAAAHRGHLANDGGREVHELRRRHDEERFKVMAKLVVQCRHLELVLEVGDSAQALNHHMGIKLMHAIDKQALEADNAHVGKIGNRFLNQANAGFKVEDGALLRRLGNRHHYFIEDLRGARNDIEMACGNGIEGSRNNRSFHYAS